MKPEAYVMEEPRLDKTSIQIGTIDDPPSDREYWASRTPAERLAAVEYLRRLNYGHARATARLERVLEIAEFPRPKDVADLKNL